MSLHTDLMAPALAGAGPKAIAQVLGTSGRGRVLCLDWRAEVVAHGDSTDPLGAPSEQDLASFWPLPGETHMIETPDGTHCRARAIVLGDEVEGYVVIETQPGWDELATLACEQAATVFALEFAKIRSADQVESAFHGDLYDELTSGREIDVGSVLRRATRLGCELEQPHVIVVVRPLRELADGRSVGLEPRHPGRGLARPRGVRRQPDRDPSPRVLRGRRGQDPTGRRSVRPTQRHVQAAGPSRRPHRGKQGDHSRRRLPAEPLGG